MIEAEKFLKLYFHLPDPKKTFSTILITSVLYGFLSAYFLTEGLQNWWIFTLLYLIPSLVYATYLKKFVDNFHPRRAFTLPLINQTLLFVLILCISFLSFPPDDLLYGFLALIYSINILSIIGVSNNLGPKPLFQPWIYMGIVASFLTFYLGVPQTSNLFLKVGGVLAFGVLTYFWVYLVDRTFRISVSDSPVKLFSALINDEPVSLDSSIEIKTILQKLKLRNENEYTISIPWLHPGPAASLGGGALSTQVINKLNEKGKGFFWHFPSSHKSDPANSNVIEKILQKNLDEEKFFDRASRLVEVEKDSYKVFGHKIGDFYLIFTEGEEDDYELPIFKELRERIDGRVVFVDTHQHSPFSHDKLLSWGEEGANLLKEAVLELVGRLDKEKQFNFKAEMKISEDRKFMLLAMDISGEKYLYITLDINGISSELREKIEELEESSKFDEVVSLTTDAHKNVEFLEREDKLDLQALHKAVRDIEDKLKKSEIGLAENEIEVPVLGKNCYFFESSTNWVIHLFPILLIFHYSLLLLFLL